MIYWIKDFQKNLVCQMLKSKVVKDRKYYIKLSLLWLSVIFLYFIVQSYMKERFELIRTGPENSECLPYNLFIVDTYDKQISTGNYFTFKIKGLEPKFKDGSYFTKLAAATEGELIEVKKDKVRAANGFYGPLDLLDKLGKEASEFERTETVPKGKIFALGTRPNSYDSRYWGYVDVEQIYGRTYAIY
jgi:conjugal transfer pilin signal peptidase TrbI